MAVLFKLLSVIRSSGKRMILESVKGFKTEWFRVAKKKF